MGIRKLGDIGELRQRFNDNERIEGTIEEILEASLNFVRRNIGKMVIIDNDGNKKQNNYVNTKRNN